MDKDKLSRTLGDLRSCLPELLKDFPDEADFYSVFSAEVEVVTEEAGEEHAEWIDGQITAMLAEFASVWKPT